MKTETLNFFLSGLKILNLKLAPQQTEQFSIYLDELKKWNEQFNLIGPATDEEIVQKHFLDSLSVLLAFPTVNCQQPTAVLDIGTGAGFPGIPVKIARPEIFLTLLDSSKKKTEFLRHLCKKLNITADIIWDRAESIATKTTKRYDIIITRAVAKLAKTEKLCQPLLNKDGIVLLLISQRTDIKNIKGEIMKKFTPPAELLPGRTILAIRKQKNGFTLIEVMIAVAIIAILVSVIFPKFAEMMRKTKEGYTKGGLGNLRSAIGIYYGAMEGVYPLEADAFMGRKGPIQTKYLESMPTVKIGLSAYEDTDDMDDFDEGDSLTDLGNWGYISTIGSVFVNANKKDTRGEYISSW